MTAMVKKLGKSWSLGQLEEKTMKWLWVAAILGGLRVVAAAEPVRYAVPEPLQLATYAPETPVTPELIDVLENNAYEVLMTAGGRNLWRDAVTRLRSSGPGAPAWGVQRGKLLRSFGRNLELKELTWPKQWRIHRSLRNPAGIFILATAAGSTPGIAIFRLDPVDGSIGKYCEITKQFTPSNSNEYGASSTFACDGRYAVIVPSFFLAGKKSDLVKAHDSLVVVNLADGSTDRIDDLPYSTDRGSVALLDGKIYTVLRGSAGIALMRCDIKGGRREILFDTAREEPRNRFDSMKFLNCFAVGSEECKSLLLFVSESSIRPECIYELDPATMAINSEIEVCALHECILDGSRIFFRLQTFSTLQYCSYDLNSGKRENHFAVKLKEGRRTYRRNPESAPVLLAGDEVISNRFLMVGPSLAYGDNLWIPLEDPRRTVLGFESSRPDAVYTVGDGKSLWFIFADRIVKATMRGRL